MSSRDESPHREFGTPQDLFDYLDERFHFTLDAAASPANTKCARFYTKEDDALKQRWDGAAFCLPPYGSFLDKFVAKGWYESQILGHGTAVMLLPARTATAWWHDYVMSALEVILIRGRLHFEGSKVNAPFANAIAIFVPGQQRWIPTFYSLDWRKGRSAMALNKGLFSSNSGKYGTPQKLFDLLDQTHHFTLDAAASPDNAKCAKYYTEEDNALEQPWTGTVWCNPPYGREIGKFVKKGYEEACKGAFVWMLLPARTDTSWWHEYVMKAEWVVFIRGRLRFEGAHGNAPFPSALVLFVPGPLPFRPKIETLDWRGK